MSRSAIDATRFTANSLHALHAYAKPSPLASLTSSSSFSPAKGKSAPSEPFPRPTKPSLPSRVPKQSSFKKELPQPPTETAAQKIARLRAERTAMREAQITRWDRIVERGRIIADKAHRITVVFLITFSVVAFGATVIVIADMIGYNRKKRKAWYADRKREREEGLMAAIENEKAGLPLSDFQALIMEEERTRFEEAEERARKKRERWQFLNFRSWLVSGLKSDEEQIDQRAVEGDAPSTGIETMEIRSQETPEPEPTEPEPTEPEPTGRSGGVLAAVEDARRVGEKQLEAEGAQGGALDRMAARAAELGKGKGWWGWGSGKE